MAKTRALSRVRRDLAKGHRNAAVARLRTLLAAYPGDIHLYRLLAQIHRDAGNLAEAGRWGYVTDEVSEAEIRAFEEAHPAPWVRLRLISWAGDPWKVPSEAGRSRLRVLLNETAEATVPIQRRRVVHGVPVSSIATPHATRVGERTETLDKTTALPHQPATGSGADEPGTTTAIPAGGGAVVTTGSQADSPVASLVPGQRGAPGGLRESMTRRRPVPQTGTDLLLPPTTQANLHSRSARNFVLLALLILLGGIGSIAAVIGVLALLGIHSWP